ncbi:glutaminase [Acrasis kona]|uniref:glutaminase n=1 Tax=Acrasis kona TaxID=1008807 RepID=A0AAW2YYC4_9EUKA
MSRLFGKSISRINNNHNHNMETLLESIVARKRSEIQQKFNKYDTDHKGYIHIEDLCQALADCGLQINHRIERIIAQVESNGRIDMTGFTKLMTGKKNLVQKALSGELAIPNFAGFCDDLNKIFLETKKQNPGNLANYIPELGTVDPEYFGMSLCTVDGQAFSAGDSRIDFTLQSTMLPIVYCLACEQVGYDRVHEFIGKEPSGSTYNAFVLNSENKPHNPMINTGGIICCSILEPQDNQSNRFGNLFDFVSSMAGDSKITFHQRTYLSEKEHGDRNAALAYYMRGAEVKGLDGKRLPEVLDFYFQACSIACNTEDLSVIAATLAKGGICPLTNKRVLQTSTVRNCLSLLYSCGMYDYSGQWAFTIGLPAKSGVSGNIMVIIPNVMGLALYSPKVDKRGNSVRGIEFCKRLISQFSLSIFDNLVGGVSSKVDPTTDATPADNVMVE